jgi:DNA-binding NtrC family response regulator
MPASQPSILVVDDEPIIRDSLAEFLGQEGFSVTACGSAEEALRRAPNTAFAVALCDVQLPGMNGVALLDRLLKINPETLVLLITAYGTVESAIAAFQRGAHDYLMKPIMLDEVLVKIRRLLGYRDLRLENQWLRRQLHRVEGGSMVVGHSPAMQRVMEMVRKVAPTRSTVLLVGESGTGKELLARALHDQASESPGRFLAVNCAAIPHELLENQLFGHRKGAFTGADRDQPGMFLHASGGTIFLDEVGELLQATQAKLLRAIEQKEILPIGAQEPIAFDARILAATNKNLAKEVEVGRFREDLYYRLNVVSIVLPPLRERREDIPDLVETLLVKHSRALGKKITGVTHETMQFLIACPWKGNIRELDNALQRAVILGEGPLLEPGDFPPDLVPQPEDPALVDDLGEAVRRFERLHLQRLLRRYPDKKEAARRLGMGLSSLYRRIAELGIEI